MRIRTLFALLLAAMLAAATVGGSVVAQAPVRVFVDGEQVQFDQPPIVVGSRVLVPLRGIFEKMGAFVEWIPATRTVRAVRATTVVELQIGSPVARVNGSPITMDVPAQIIGGRTLVPLRFISESLGATVQYDAANRTVIITTAGAGPPPPPPPPPPAGQTAKGVITAVVLAQTTQDYPTVTVESGNIAYRVRVTVDTAITRIDVSSGAGGSVGVAALKPGDDAEVTFANNVATRIRATYLMTTGKIEAIARAGATLVLTDGRSIKWVPQVVVLVNGRVASNGAEALRAGQVVDIRLNPTTREAWEINITSGATTTTGEMTLNVTQPRPGATVANPIRVVGTTVGGAEVEIVVTWFLGAQVGRKVIQAASGGRFDTTVPITIIQRNSSYLITVIARHAQRGQRQVQFTVTVR
ncbi:MAG TPA: copper amine oxidase N-terminal domain-containing protein [bacterium]|nr:copper amine oxidase N-terminal domain-containing protein [bacterium]